MRPCFRLSGQRADDVDGEHNEDHESDCALNVHVLSPCHPTEVDMPDFDDTQIRIGIAAIAAAFAKTMQKRDPEFGLDFTNYLDAAYSALRHSDQDNTKALEMIKWTGEAMERL